MHPLAQKALEIALSEAAKRAGESLFRRSPKMPSATPEEVEAVRARAAEHHLRTFDPRDLESVRVYVGDTLALIDACLTVGALPAAHGLAEAFARIVTIYRDAPSIGDFRLMTATLFLDHWKRTGSADPEAMAAFLPPSVRGTIMARDDVFGVIDRMTVEAGDEEASAWARHLTVVIWIVSAIGLLWALSR